MADLIHTGFHGHFIYCFPLGIGLISAYLLKKFPGEISVELFKFPEDLSGTLSRQIPKIMCFANYSWNLNISYEYIKVIKERVPQTIVIMGGPNYGFEKHEISKFWEKYPLIDFYIVLEGELAMAEIVKVLYSFDFDVDAIKESGIKIPNCHYKVKDKIIKGALLSRIENIDALPSPYLMGLMDKFFDEELSPMIQTARGCPYQCTFCTEGNRYYNKVLHRSDISEELNYISQKAVLSKSLTITDANWGMFRQDIEKAELLRGLNKKYAWPDRIFVSSGKNKKKQVDKVFSLLEGVMAFGGSVQSMDLDVLKNIKRKNISFKELGWVGKKDSYTEVILALPGDSFEKHAKTLKAVVDAGFNGLILNQLAMLPQTELNSIETRKNYKIKTKYQLMQRSFGKYEVLGEKFTAIEYEELCVSNSTMTFVEYVDSRELDLIVRELNKVNISPKLFKLCKQLNISWFDILLACYKRRRNYRVGLKKTFNTYRKELLDSLWDSEGELADKVKKNINYYLNNDKGSKDMAFGRAVSKLRNNKDLSGLLLSEMEQYLNRQMLMTEDVKSYLNQLNCLLPQ